MDSITHFLLEDFCSIRKTKVETLVAVQPNMSGECGQRSTVRLKRDLVVPLIQINLTKYSTAI